LGPLTALSRPPPCVASTTAIRTYTGPSHPLDECLSRAVSWPSYDAGTRPLV